MIQECPNRALEADACSPIELRCSVAFWFTILHLFIYYVSSITCLALLDFVSCVKIASLAIFRASEASVNGIITVCSSSTVFTIIYGPVEELG